MSRDEKNLVDDLTSLKNNYERLLKYVTLHNGYSKKFEEDLTSISSNVLDFYEKFSTQREGFSFPIAERVDSFFGLHVYELEEHLDNKALDGLELSLRRMFGDLIDTKIENLITYVNSKVSNKCYMW